MNLKEELKNTNDKWLGIGQRLAQLKQESDALQIQGRQLEGRYQLLEEMIKEEDQKNENQQKV